jgi:DNA primase
VLQDAVSYIKQIVNPLDLLKHYNAKCITESSTDIRCKCPIHGGDNPTAFVFNKENKLWFCHTRCNTGGDIYDLVMQIEHLDFVGAVQRIAEIFGINISKMAIKVRTDKTLQDTKKWIQTMRDIVDSKVENKAFDISILGDLYTIKSYRQFNSETLNHFGIKYCKNNARVVVPIYENKQLVGVTMRRTNKHPAKWLHQPTGLQMRNILYNFDNVESNQPLIICEGVFDVLGYWQNGFTNVVATFGCHMSEEQEKLILKKTYDIILSYDNDTAGAVGTNNVIKSLKDKVNIRVADLPDGFDPGMASHEQLEHALINALRIHQWRSINENRCKAS